MGASSGMPRPQVQISSMSRAEERSPVSEPLSSIHQSSSVGDLLTSLFRQTIYNRIENLLLDPGRPSMVKRRIIDSAVRNYHNQQYSAPPPISEERNSRPETVSQSFKLTGSEIETTITISEEKEKEFEKNSDDQHSMDISSLAGNYWFELN